MTFRKISVIVLIVVMLFQLHIFESDNAAAETFTDDFSGPVISARWSKGGVGKVMIKPDAGLLCAESYDGTYYDNWHGPFIRTNLAAFSDFNITTTVRGIAIDSKMNCLYIRVLDDSGKQLYSFGWEKKQKSDSMSEISLYGPSEKYYGTGLSKFYSNIFDMKIGLTKVDNNLSFYVDGTLKTTKYHAASNGSYVEIFFAKYMGECTLSTLEMNSISIDTDGTATNTNEVPGPPENFTIEAGNKSASLKWSPPSDNGGLPISNYKIYRGNASGNESLLTTVSGTLGYNDNSLTNGQEYFYMVTATNSLGEGPAASASVVPSSDSNEDNNTPEDPIDDSNDSPSDSYPVDTDNDGIYDSEDDFPEDSAASIDTDDDGLPDDWNDGYTEEDSTTNLTLDDDDDNDGIPDIEDDNPAGIPHDGTITWKDYFTPTSSIATVAIFLIGIIAFVLFLRSGDGSRTHEDKEEAKQSEAKKSNKRRNRRNN